MNIKALLESRQALVTKSQEFLKIEEPTEEQIEAQDKVTTELEALNEKIERYKKYQAAAKPIDAADFGPSSEPEPKADVQEPEWKKDPKRGFKSTAEFFSTVISNTGPGQLRDERLKTLTFKAAVGSDEQMASNDGYGGFLVPEGFSPNLLQRSPEMDPFAGRVTNIPMSTTSIKIPARTDNNHTSSVAGGITVSRKPETVAADATRSEYEQVRLEPTELVGATHASETVLQYSAISFAALIENNFRQQFTHHLIDETLNGTGNGEFEGINTCPATISQAEESTQTGASLIYENIVNMRSRCWGYEQAIWIANHDVLPSLMAMVITSSAVAPIWQPSAREDHPDMLLGRPLFFSEYAETLGTSGDILCLNMSQYLVGTLGGFEQAESIHVRFLNRERTFRFSIMNDGASWWRAALTPAKSSTTLSPFVKMATRT